jgi:transcription elongation factor Elf1
MTTLFKTVKCPRCNEDYLLITMNNDAGKLYLSCSECEASWNHPDEVIFPEKMFVNLDIDASDPSINDIRAANWLGYVSGTLES